MSVWVKDKSAIAYPGEATEDNIVYSGYIVKAVSLLAEGFAPGEEAMLHLEGHAERIGPGYSAWFSWATTYKVFKSDGTPLTSKTIHHWIAPWTTHDYADDRFDIGLGLMPETPLYGYGELWVGGSPDVLVDTKDFVIPLLGEAPEKKVPWGWIAAGGGLLALGLIISARR